MTTHTVQDKHGDSYVIDGITETRLWPSDYQRATRDECDDWRGQQCR